MVKYDVSAVRSVRGLALKRNVYRNVENILTSHISRADGPKNNGRIAELVYGSGIGVIVSVVRRLKNIGFQGIFVYCGYSLVCRRVGVAEHKNRLSVEGCS